MTSKSNELVNLADLRRAIRLFRGHDKKASGILIEAFLTIATAEQGVSQRELASSLDVTESAVNHIVGRLGSTPPRLGGTPLRLVHVRPDPTNGQRNTVSLSELGEQLANAMTTLVPLDRRR